MQAVLAPHRAAEGLLQGLQAGLLAISGPQAGLDLIKDEFWVFQRLFG